MSFFTLSEDITTNIINIVDYIDIVSFTDINIVWLFSSLLTIITETIKKSHAAALFLFTNIL
jgi:hypothetical protein